MLSFAKIVAFATIALGTLVSVVVASAETCPLTARQIAGLDVTTVLQGLNTALMGPVGQLNALTSTTATPSNVLPIVVNIQSLIQSAVSTCAGLPAGTGNLLVLLSIVFNQVVCACGRVYNLPGVDQIALKVIFQLLDAALAALIILVVSIIGGIVTVVIGLLVGLINACLEVILELGFSETASDLLL